MTCQCEVIKGHVPLNSRREHGPFFRVKSVSIFEPKTTLKDVKNGITKLKIINIIWRKNIEIKGKTGTLPGFPLVLTAGSFPVRKMDKIKQYLEKTDYVSIIVPSFQHRYI